MAKKKKAMGRQSGDKARRASKEPAAAPSEPLPSEPISHQGELTDSPASSSPPSPSSPPPPSSPPVPSSAPASMKEPPRAVAPWARPLIRVERIWTTFESRLLFVVLVALLAALVSWVALAGLSSPMATGNSAGTVFRGIVGTVLLGMAARFATRNRGLSDKKRNAITLGAVLIGAFIAPLWRPFGVDYFGQWLNWLQEGSSLTLFGGLRGISTRLTILLALVGASLAAGSGKHINIDVVLRLIPAKLRIPVHVIGAMATAAVCFGASWGFFDYISIEGFGVDREASAGEKVRQVKKSLGDDFFIWRKQVSLDISALPDVVAGTPWDDPSRMNGEQWNEFIRDGGFEERFGKEKADSLLAPDFALQESRVPLAIMPGKTTRGLLVHGMNLMFPIGLIFIGLRVFLRSVLVIAGHATVEPDPDEFEGEPVAAAVVDAGPLKLADDEGRRATAAEPPDEPDDGPVDGPDEAPGDVGTDEGRG